MVSHSLERVTSGNLVHNEVKLINILTLTFYKKKKKKKNLYEGQQHLQLIELKLATEPASLIQQPEFMKQT